jgi:hypothetical protein
MKFISRVVNNNIPFINGAHQSRCITRSSHSLDVFGSFFFVNPVLCCSHVLETDLESWSRLCDENTVPTVRLPACHVYSSFPQKSGTELRNRPRHCVDDN